MNKFDNREPQIADLKTVLALLQDGTVTRAAQRLGLTQSALSYQLERMRRRFSDPLFVRVGNRMAPTPFAQRLAEPAARVMRIVEAEIATLSSFDPASTRREFRIGMNEIGAITLLPRLVRRMAQQAPHARLTPMHVDADSLAAALESGTMDVAAGHFPRPRGDLLQQLLYRRDYVCIVRRDHPYVGRSMSLRQLSRVPQIQAASMLGAQTWVQARLGAGKLDGTVQMSTQHIAAIPFVVAASDHAAMIPREVYELFSPIAAIRTVKLPLAIPAVAIHQYWHRRMASDPAVKFLRGVVLAAARDPTTRPASDAT